jgi:uncharacterized membrane protein SirB2
MQRALSYALSPAQGIPLRFLLTAPWFALLACVLLLFAGDTAFGSRWSGAALAATHLVTLGFLSMAMAGSMLQLIPVVAGHRLDIRQGAAVFCWLGLATGTVLLAGAFWSGQFQLFVPAAAILVLAFGALIATIAGALLRSAPPAALPMVVGMRVAVPGLAVALGLGAALAASLGGKIALPLLMVTELHVAWGALGWVAMLILCVSFQVIPMFQATPAYPQWLTRIATPLLAALLLGWSGIRLLAPPAALGLAAIGVSLLALCLATYAVLSLWLLSRRKKKPADATTLYWRLSLSCLGACVPAYLLAPDSSATPLALGLLFLAGFAASAVNGMLYKIVPFLLWYHLQQDPRAGKADVPPIRTIVSDAAGRTQFCLHALGLAALLLSLYGPRQLVRPAAALMALAFLRLALDLHGAAWRCRAIGRRCQPS